MNKLKKKQQQHEAYWDGSGPSTAMQTPSCSIPQWLCCFGYLRGGLLLAGDWAEELPVRGTMERAFFRQSPAPHIHSQNGRPCTTTIMIHWYHVSKTSKNIMYVRMQLALSLVLVILHHFHRCLKISRPHRLVSGCWRLLQFTKCALLLKLIHGKRSPDPVWMRLCHVSLPLSG